MNYNSAFQDEIDSLHRSRYFLVEQLQSLGDTNGKEEKELNEHIDKLSKEILNTIKKYGELLPLEFIMMQLSNLGWCPNLLNDDNGHWAFASDGFQNVVYGDEPEDVETSFFVEAKYWKKTPKEALNFYLNEE